MKPHTSFMAGLAVAAALALAGCAGATSGGPVSWDDDPDFGVPGEVLETHADVPFYPACGNEILTWEGTSYYPYSPTQLDAFPDPTDQVARASALETVVPPAWSRMSAPLPAVPMPEPGDDTGTLVMYEGGHAYWTSDNGELSTWLTTTELEYNWIC